MSVIGLKDDDGVLSQALFLQVIEHPTDQLVGGGHERGVLVRGDAEDPCI